MHFFFPRRVLAVIFSALLGVVAFSTVAGTASADVWARQVSWDDFASMTIKDDEAWPSSDVVEKHSLAAQKPFFVTAVNPVQTRTITRCTGDEVRVELHMRVELIWADQVRVTGTAYMYEGASCTSNDLDGTKSFAYTIANNRTLRPSPIELPNVEEGGDMAYIQLSLTNTSSAI